MQQPQLQQNEQGPLTKSIVRIFLCYFNIFYSFYQYFKYSITFILLLGTYTVTLLLASTAIAASPQKPAPPSSPPPKAIVSLTVASDEVVYTLAKDIPALQARLVYSSLAGNPLYSHISSFISGASKPRTASTNIEQLLALNPEMVFVASFNHPHFLEALRNQNIPFTKLKEFSSLEAIALNILTISKAIHKEREGKALVATIRSQTAKLTEQAKKLPTPPQVLNYSTDGFVYGSDTIYSDMLELAGGKNLAKSWGVTNWAKLSNEQFLKASPDVIITGAANKTEEDKIYKTLLQDPIWRDKTAVKKRNIIFLHPRQLLASSHFALETAAIIQEQLLEFSGSKTPSARKPGHN